MLVYLIIHSCPDFSNATRELLKANDGANPAALKEVLDVIKYVMNTKNLGLKIECRGNSIEPRDIKCFKDSNYVGDPVSRRSIRRFILYLLGTPVSWQPTLQKMCTLQLSSGACSLSWSCKEVIFIFQLLGSMKILVKYPVMVRVDNIGARFMVSNITTTPFNKHVEIRCKYVNEYVENRIVKMFLLSLLTITATSLPKT